MTTRQTLRSLAALLVGLGIIACSPISRRDDRFQYEPPKEGAETGGTLITASISGPNGGKIEGSGNLAGASVSFPPGTLVVNTSVTVGGASVNLSETATSYDLIPVDSAPATAPIAVVPAAKTDPAAPFTIALPIPTKTSLAESQPVYAVVYSVVSFAKNVTLSGVKTDVKIEDGKIVFQTSLFGSFQAFLIPTGAEVKAKAVETAYKEQIPQPVAQPIAQYTPEKQKAPSTTSLVVELSPAPPRSAVLGSVLRLRMPPGAPIQYSLRVGTPCAEKPSVLRAGLSPGYSADSGVAKEGEEISFLVSDPVDYYICLARDGGPMKEYVVTGSSLPPEKTGIKSVDGDETIKIIVQRVRDTSDNTLRVLAILDNYPGGVAYALGSLPSGATTTELKSTCEGHRSTVFSSDLQPSSGLTRLVEYDGAAMRPLPLCALVKTGDGVVHSRLVMILPEYITGEGEKRREERYFTFGNTDLRVYIYIPGVDGISAEARVMDDDQCRKPDSPGTPLSINGDGEIIVPNAVTHEGVQYVCVTYTYRGRVVDTSSTQLTKKTAPPIIADTFFEVDNGTSPNWWDRINPEIIADFDPGHTLFTSPIHRVTARAYVTGDATQVLFGVSDTDSCATLTPVPFDGVVANFDITSHIPLRQGDLNKTAAPYRTICIVARDDYGNERTLKERLYLSTVAPLDIAGAPEKRLEPQRNAIWAGDKLVVLGGKVWDGSGYVYMSDDIRVFEAANNRWLNRFAATYGAKENSLAVFANDKVYYFGGQYNSNAVLGGSSFDLPTGSWSSQPVAPSNGDAIINGSATLVGDKIFLFGGRVGNVAAGVGKSGPVFSVGTETWVTASFPSYASFPKSAREKHVAVAAGDRLVVFGGEDGSGAPLWDGAYYIPAEDAWFDIPAPPPGFESRVGVRAIATPDKKVIFFGGQYNDSPRSSAAYLDMAGAPTWHMMPSFDKAPGWDWSYIGTEYPTAAAVGEGGTVYFMGGYTRSIDFGLLPSPILTVYSIATDEMSYIDESRTHPGAGWRSPLITYRPEMRGLLVWDGATTPDWMNLVYIPVPAP